METHRPASKLVLALLCLGVGLAGVLLPRVGEGQGLEPAAAGLAQGVELLDPGDPLPPLTPFFPFLPPLPEGGVSLGTTSTGKLLNADALPLEHPSMRIMPRQKARSLHFGNRSMIQSLLEAAEAVAQRHPGSILSLGDVAAEHGGDIWWSVSHNNGRDADIAFFYRSRTGEEVVPEDFIPLNARGRSADRTVVFDPERTWTVVRTLILSPSSTLQWLFISRPLREALLIEARRLGESPELIAKAEELLGQPGDALAHNDHLHVRLLCTPLEIVSGCTDMGRIPSWVEDPARLRQARSEQLWQMLRAEDPERRGRAAELLGYLGAATAWSGIERLLADPVPRVQRSAARGLELLIGHLPAAVGVPLREASLLDEDTDSASAEAPLGVKEEPAGRVVTPTPAPLGGSSPAAAARPEEEFTGGLGAPPEFPPAPDALPESLGSPASAPARADKIRIPSRSDPSDWERSATWPAGDFLPKTLELTSSAARSRLAEQLLARLEEPLEPEVQEAFLAVLVRLEWSKTLDAPFLRRWLESAGGAVAGGKIGPSGGAGPPTLPSDSTGLPRTVFEGQPGMLARGLKAPTEAQQRHFHRILAIRAIGELGEGAEPFLPALRQRLRHSEDAVVQASLESLALLTNQVPAEGRALREQAAELGRWLDASLQGDQGCQALEQGLVPMRSGPCSLDGWWLSSFRSAGFPVSSLSLFAVPVLEKALYAPFPLSVNAHRLLMRLTGARLDHAPDRWEEVQIFWARWLKRNGAKVYPPAPKKVSQKASQKAGAKKATSKKATSKKATSKKGTNKPKSGSKKQRR